jgi:hypothetical protein
MSVASAPIVLDVVTAADKVTVPFPSAAAITAEATILLAPERVNAPEPIKVRVIGSVNVTAPKISRDESVATVINNWSFDVIPVASFKVNPPVPVTARTESAVVDARAPIVIAAVAVLIPESPLVTVITSLTVIAVTPLALPLPSAATAMCVSARITAPASAELLIPKVEPATTEAIASEFKALLENFVFESDTRSLVNADWFFFVGFHVFSPVIL